VDEELIASLIHKDVYILVVPCIKESSQGENILHYFSHLVFFLMI
jgi:hypothetical protein